MHGDHVLGLPGLLNSFSLSGRDKRLQVIGPVGIKSFVNQNLKSTYSHLTYQIDFVEIDSSRLIASAHNNLSVEAIPLSHRVPTWGYVIREHHQEDNIDSEAIDRYKLTVEEIVSIKKGASITRDGVTLERDRLILPAKISRSFAYCTDTVFDPSIIERIKGVDLLYHEATYTHDLADKARLRMHSTAREAATIARDARVKKLIIGHYSSRYTDLTPLLKEARDIFAESYLAIEGEIFNI